MDQLGFIAGHDGNLSARIDEDRWWCTPSGRAKGHLATTDLVMIDAAGCPLDGVTARPPDGVTGLPTPRGYPSSEIGLHMAVYRRRPETCAVVHCHPPHATAFAITGTPIPAGVSPEVETQLGEIGVAPYASPGTPAMAQSIEPLIPNHVAILLANHGTVTFGESIEQALWRTEILDAHCRRLILARSLGPVQRLDAEEVTRLRK